jgi:hypothetical protein
MPLFKVLLEAAFEGLIMLAVKISSNFLQFYLLFSISILYLYDQNIHIKTISVIVNCHVVLTTVTSFQVWEVRKLTRPDCMLL